MKKIVLAVSAIFLASSVFASSTQLSTEQKATLIATKWACKICSNVPGGTASGTFSVTGPYGEESFTVTKSECEVVNDTMASEGLKGPDGKTITCQDLLDPKNEAKATASADKSDCEDSSSCTSTASTDQSNCEDGSSSCGSNVESKTGE